ncbi:MAG: hypothetical protein EBY22_14270 [Gammaproteobacteria bacterium]|nr:hypothetical protein [Gammaproteobacteria bacterium]
MLAGFPWVSAVVLYTLSWGWSLLRPNTLYWDDWEEIFNRADFYLWRYVRAMGRPPWSNILDEYLISIGPWTVRMATFGLFFSSGLLLFLILHHFAKVNLEDTKLIVILFLVIPVNHSRVALVIFDYTTSYFLFYLGWFVLVRYKSVKSFVLACVILFLSFKTHSFLFFVLLPFLHFIWLSRSEVRSFKYLTRLRLQVVVVALMPFLYLLLREFLWPPSEEWAGYQKPSRDGFVLWVPFLVPFVLGSILIVLCRKFKKSISTGFLMMWIGIGAIALALLPYFAAGLFPDYVSVIALRSDWSSRHQLLMPLGLALFIVGLNEFFKRHLKNTIFVLTVTVSLIFNTYFGSNYYLDSIKKGQIVQLFANRSDLYANTQLVILDQTKRFNGRGSTYRDYEWIGLLKSAGHDVESVSGKVLCSAKQNAVQFSLQSKVSYIQALLTRDLGLFFDVKPCSQVLEVDN